MLCALLTLVAPQVDVYVLAGQSNMEGKARVALMDVQRDQPPCAPYRQGGGWQVRDGVWIQFLDRSGPLTVRTMIALGGIFGRAADALNG